MATTLLEGAQIVNESLRTLGYEYQIDTTDNDTITAGLESIGAYAPSQRNAIMEQMNLVLQQRNYGVMFDAAKNKFRVFLVDMMENGFGIEDVFHHIIDGREPFWDNNETPENIAKDLVSYEMGKITKVFHTEPMERQFKGTIDRRNYEKVFTAYGITRFIDVTLANLSWSAEIWLQKQIISIATKMVADGKIVFNSGNNINTEQGIRNAVESIKSTVNGFLTPNALYNYGAYDEESQRYVPVVNMSESMEDIFIITTPEYMERLKVQGYANAFNLSQFELEGRIIFAPSGTDFGKHNSEDVAFIIVDRRTLVCGIKQWFASSFFVPNTKTTNHWLTVEGIKGYNTVFNAVAVTIEPIDDVAVNPQSNGLNISYFKYQNGLDGGATFRVNGRILNMKETSLEAGQTPDNPDYSAFYLNNSEFIPSGTEIDIEIYGDGNYYALYVDDKLIATQSPGTLNISVTPNRSIYVKCTG